MIKPEHVKKEKVAKRAQINWDEGNYDEIMKKIVKKYAQDEMKLEVDKAVKNWRTEFFWKYFKAKVETLCDGDLTKRKRNIPLP